MSVRDRLYGVDPEDYGEEYSSHLLDQYKLYVEMVDRISARRQSANSFFLTMNSALLTFAGFFTRKEDGVSAPLAWLIVVGLVGFLLCLTWYRLVRSYRDLNTAKFTVIHEIETGLPLALFGAEWESVGRGQRPDLYLPFTTIELRIPALFAVLYAGLIVYRSVAALT